jgi:geranylgeranyl diphosphate synthase, type II
MKCSRKDPKILRAVVDRRLAALSGPPTQGSELDRALRYVVLAPGKRIRPILTVYTGWELGQEDLRALDAGCALELVHAASLVLDDMPCMDDAMLRRGQPTAHVAFGEDVAMLASIALLSRAFGLLSTTPHILPATRARLVAILADAVGTDGLAGGQLNDLRSGRNGSVRDLADRNHLKTGVLFVAAVEMAAAISGVEDDRLVALRDFANELGQAFQLFDDLLDADASAQAIGKDINQDADKETFVSLLGRDEVARRLHGHLDAALAYLTRVSGGTGPLTGFIRSLFEKPQASAIFSK